MLEEKQTPTELELQQICETQVFGMFWADVLTNVMMV